MDNPNSKTNAAILLDADLTLENAEEWRGRILASVNGGSGPVLIDLGSVRNADLFGIQLICSAHRSAAAQHRNFGLAGELPEAVRQVLEKSGLDAPHGCTSGLSACPWAKGRKIP